MSGEDPEKRGIEEFLADPHIVDRMRTTGAAEREMQLEDIEVREATTVGSTRYIRGYAQGTDREELWAQRDSGNLEFITDDNTGSPRSAYLSLTGEGAPTELGEQMQAEAEHSGPEDPSVERQQELERFLEEYPTQVEMAQEDLDSGALTQDQFDDRISQLEGMKSGMEEELATFQHGHTPDPQILESYAAELADNGITADALSTHDWQPQQQDPEPPGNAPAPEPELDDDFDIDM